MDKEILLLAYTNKNFGDDMFVKTICCCLSQQNFVMEASEDYKILFESQKNLEIKVVTRAHGILRRILNRIVKLFQKKHKRYSAIVYVIGALFDENELWHNRIKEVGLNKFKYCFWQGKYGQETPFFLLGCNMTKVRTQEYIQQMEFLFAGLKDVCFRDKYSYSFFKHLPNVRYAPDIVLNYECKKIENKNGIVISVWGPLTQGNKFPQWVWAEHLYEPYEKYIIDIIRTFLDRGEKVTLLSMCENEGDLYACRQIVTKGQFGDLINVVNYCSSIDEIVSLFENARFVVGTRFHSIVMALNAGCSFYPIIYERKTEQLLNDIHYDGDFSNIEDIDSYDVDKVVRAYERNIVVNCDDFKKRASEQFMKLREYLKSE